MMLGRTGTLAAVAWVAGCGPRVRSPPLPTETEWLRARASLAELRATVPSRPFGDVVSVVLREPFTGRTFHARGAVAVDPHRALRLILLGPGGTTAIDVWATPDRWRFEIPAASILRRGGREDDAALPVGFFRWWFLAPLEGRLLTSVALETGTRFVLRAGDATVDLTDARGGAGRFLTAARRSGGLLDTLDFRGDTLAMAPGDHATYDQGSSGVHVEVTVESPSDAPDPAAFVDPDADAKRGGGS